MKPSGCFFFFSPSISDRKRNDVLVPPDTADKDPKRVPVPAGEASPLHYYTVAIGIMQEIMENEAGRRVFPAFHLAEPKIIENSGIAPPFDRVEALAKTQEIMHIPVMEKRPQQPGILRLETETHRLPVEHRTISGIKTAGIFCNHVP